MPSKSEASIPRIKVCGLTRVEDAQAALRFGADALGFVHVASSPRCASIETITGVLGSIDAPRNSYRSVLVLVGATPAGAFELAARTGVNTIQLAGPARAADWASFPLPILRSLAVNEQAIESAESWTGIAAGFVLDHPSGHGGTGREVQAALAASLCRKLPCLLAGGISGDNVRERILAIAPLGVDASSKLEQSAGKKDVRKLETYITQAHTALRTSSATTR